MGQSPGKTRAQKHAQVWESHLEKAPPSRDNRVGAEGNGVSPVLGALWGRRTGRAPQSSGQQLWAVQGWWGFIKCQEDSALQHGQVGPLNKSWVQPPVRHPPRLQMPLVAACAEPPSRGAGCGL